jgi:hypothetical protein
MSLQPAATVNVSCARLSAMIVRWLFVTAPFGPTCAAQFGGGVEEQFFVSFVSRAAAGASPFPHFATSCTFSQTTVAEPAAYVPENVKPLSLPKWFFAISVQVEPLSAEAQTRTSGFVRDLLVASEPFQAVAVYDTLPWQSMLPAISE